MTPLADLAFLIATPLAIVPLVTLLAWRWFTPEQISLAVISFASLGHHLPGFMRAYGDAELFRRFRWRFLLAPPIVFATALLFAWQQWHGLQLILLFWSTWHGLMQTYGFMRIYDLKRGAADAWTAGLDFALCGVLFVAGLVFSDARVHGISDAIWQVGVPPLDAAWLHAIRWLVGIATVGVVLACGVDLVWRATTGRGVTWNKVLLAGSTAWLYWFSGSISTNLLIGVAMFEIFHALQYYAIVWVYNRKLADRVGRGFGPLGFLFQRRGTLLFLYLAAIVAYGCIRFFGDSATDPLVQRLLLALLTTSTLLHFYYDGFIWKVRESETSANLDIDPTLSRWRRFDVSAMRHVAKWGLLYGLLLVLVVVQWRNPVTPAREARHLAALVAWTPELPETKIRLAVDALDRDQGERAERLAREALAWRPRSYQAHAVLGKALLVRGQYEAAADALRQAVALDPTGWQNQRDWGMALARLGQTEAAEARLREALRLRPEQAGLWLDLGSLLAERGDTEAALETMRHAMRLNPKLVEPHLMLGATLVARGRFDEALQPLERARELAPNHAGVLYQLGLVRLRGGDAKQAEQLMQRVLQREPGHAQAHFQLGTLRYQANDFPAAEGHFRRCLEADPSLADACNNLGASLHCQGRWSEAIAAYREALRLRPDQGTWHYNLGMLLREQGSEREAAWHLMRARQLEAGSGQRPPQAGHFQAGSSQAGSSQAGPARGGL